METSKWELRILARFPRPVAVTLVMLGNFGLALLPWVIVGICILALAVLWALFGKVLPIGIVVTIALLLFFLGAYFTFDEELPKREKKDDVP